MTLQSILDNHINTYIGQPKRPASDQIYLKASFVIPVFNSSDSIQFVNDSITQQQRSDLINEIIIINDASTDTSLSAITEAALAHKDYNIVVLNNTVRKYSAFSRNKGVKYATGDLVFFVDSDIILPDNYLLEHTSVIRMKNRALHSHFEKI